MRSRITASFRKTFQHLPGDVQLQARKAYRQWRDDPYLASLRFRQVHINQPLYSVRIGMHWRAVALRDGDTYHWFWIGSHADYDDITG